MVQVDKKVEAPSDPGNALGLLAYATALISLTVQTAFRLGYSDVETFIIPPFPWLLCVTLLLRFRSKPLRAYWWVWPSMILANPYLLTIGIMMLAWSIGGFAP